MKDLAKAAAKLASPYSRHLGIFDPHKYNLSATIIGCGAVGSFVAVGMAKMGIIDQTLFDMDTTELENLPVQLHVRSKLGENKAIATKSMIEDMCPEDMQVTTMDKWTALDHVKSDIVVSAVDSLHTRKVIWEAVKLDPSCKLLLDARIGGQMMKIYAINPTDLKDIKLYDASFPKDNMDGVELECTVRGVLDVSMISAGLLIRSMRRFIVSGKKESYRICNLQDEIPNIM